MVEILVDKQSADTEAPEPCEGKDNVLAGFFETDPICLDLAPPKLNSTLRVNTGHVEPKREHAASLSVVVTTTVLSILVVLIIIALYFKIKKRRRDRSPSSQFESEANPNWPTDEILPNTEGSTNPAYRRSDSEQSTASVDYQKPSMAKFPTEKDRLRHVSEESSRPPSLIESGSPRYRPGILQRFPMNGSTEFSSKLEMEEIGGKKDLSDCRDADEYDDLINDADRNLSCDSESEPSSYCTAHSTPKLRVLDLGVT